MFDDHITYGLDSYQKMLPNGSFELNCVYRHAAFDNKEGLVYNNSRPDSEAFTKRA
jgi:hypothetical protein